MNARVLVVLAVALLSVAAFLFTRPGADNGPAPTGTHATDARATPASADVAQGNVTPASVALDAKPEGQRTEAPAVSGVGSDSVAVRGRVVDGKGAPRVGVVLSMRSWVPPGDIADMPPPPALRGRDAAKKPTWTTGSDGRFEIPIGKNEFGAIELETKDLVFAGGEPNVNGKKGDQDLGAVTVLAAAHVSGVVHDQRGLPVAGVKVAVTLGSLASIGFGAESNSTTADDGTFSLGMLRPGRWSLRTASGKFLPTVEEIEIAAEEQRTGVVLVVKPGNAIAGQVVDDRGIGVAKMKVGSKRREARAGVDIERFSADEATTTDANGYFTLSGLAEETASVRAFGPGHTSASAADVAVGTGNLVLRVDRLGIVEGVLVGADGTPIVGSRVSASGGGGANPLFDGVVVDDLAFDGPPGEGRGAVTAADGSFRLESVQPGNATIVARGKAHRPVRQAGVNVLPAQATKGVRLVADLGATARIKVSDEAGKPVARAKVSAQRASEQPGPGGGRFSRAMRVEDHGDGPVVVGGDPLGMATTGEDGVATVAGLPGGDLSFTATHDDFAPPTPVRIAVPKTGAVDGALTMRKPGVAEITVFGTDGSPQSGVELEVKAEAGSGSQRATSGDGGVVRVASLAPGDYTAAIARGATAARFGDAMVFAADGGGGVIESSAQKFTVVAGETVRVEVKRPVLAKVHGVVTNGDGPVRGCVVTLARSDGDGPGIPGFGGRNETTGDDGSFAFADVEAGRYELEYGKRDQVVKARHEFDVPANTPDVRQDLTLRTGKLRVQVVASGTGEPVEKAEVEISRADAPAASGAPAPPQRRVMMMSVSMNRDGGGPENAESTTMTMGLQRTHTDEAGVAVIDDVPIGDYTVRIRHRKHAPATLRGKAIVENQTTDLGRVELATAGLIRGKVLGTDGKPAPIALVTSRLLDSQEWSEPIMAQGGNYRVQGLAAGKYKVRAQALGPAEGYGPEVEVEVKSGETANADLQVPAQ